MRKEDNTFNKYLFIGLTILVVIVITINVTVYFIELDLVRQALTKKGCCTNNATPFFMKFY